MQLSPEAALDSLIILYPGFRDLAIREKLSRPPLKSKRDSLIEWAENNLAARLAQNGKIDPAMLKQMQLLKRYQNLGPYHVIAPGIGIGIPFDYTAILKDIISIFEKAPED